jgi:hypothetical protein
MTLEQMRTKVQQFLFTMSQDAEKDPAILKQLMCIDTLGDMLGTEFWLLLMYQQPCDPETLNRIAVALEKIEKRMPPGY